MKQVELSDRARSDLLGLVDYLNAPRATELIEAFESVLQDLRLHPELGALWEDGPTRLLRRGGYRFYYVDGTDRTLIVRIIDPQGGHQSP